LQGYFPYKPIFEGINVDVEIQGNVEVTKIETPSGTLKQVRKYLPESSVGLSSFLCKSLI